MTPGGVFFMPQITNLLKKENLKELNQNLGTNFRRVRNRRTIVKKRDIDLMELEKMMTDNRGINYDKNTY